MGQGQDVRARHLLNECLASGDWLLLHNCHLSIDFAAEIPSIIHSADGIHDSFRLWLTTQFVDKFPVSVLQVSNAIHCNQALKQHPVK
jgi:dynein heavy chain